MVKKNVNKSTKRPSTQTLAKQSGRAIETADTLTDRAAALNSTATAATPKPPACTGGLPLQPPMSVPASKPSRVPLVPPPQAPKAAGLSKPTLSPGTAGGVAEAPVLSGLPTVKVTFFFPVCECCPKHVSLSGDFNGWSPDATPMKQFDDGHWETTIELAPGRYEYKFVRDGEWMPDLLAPENVLNGYGTLNSVIEVRQAPLWAR